VVKSSKDATLAEHCVKCGSEAQRIFTTFQFYGAKDQDRYFNRGLGQVVRNDKHAEAEAKARGWEPIGNDDPNREFQRSQKRIDDKIEQRWSKV
jgi:hypothetical protein